MSKHTPGPWHHQPYDTVGCQNIVGPNGEDIAFVNCSDGLDEPTMYPSVENARLIAAAPELLGALEHLMRACTRYDDDPESTTTHALYLSARDHARAAIAKAKGEA